MGHVDHVLRCARYAAIGGVLQDDGGLARGVISGDQYLDRTIEDPCGREELLAEFRRDLIVR